MIVLNYLEKTAETYPDKIAITDENGCFTFGELRGQALSVAACIRKRIPPGLRKPVLVYLPKSKEAIAACLGIVYSGNMYTPTDVKFPFSKAQGIIDVLEPALYISDRANAAKLCEKGVPCDEMLIYEDILPEKFNVPAIISKIIDTDPVYTFFTSGSTGIPKGVTISHRSIIDYIDWATEKFDIDEGHILGNQAPFYFDNSILDIYLCLKTGAHMYIIPEELFAFPMRLLQYINEKKINFIFWVPSALCNIANKDALSGFGLPHLKKILFAGEVMPNKQLNYWREHIPDALYANLYGPTEITVDCIFYVVDRQFADDEPLPIGVPCANTGILLLDKDDSLITEADVQGEICVRGSCLATGYWNNPEKTAEVFCQNPLNPHYPEKIYRTGDIAHYNQYGEIIFDGRKDFQIKHLGYRIELGEIETVAIGVTGVSQVSTDYDHVKQEIVIFYSGKVDEIELRRELLARLPKYMVPTRCFFLDKLPLNDNGKIDRKVLKLKYMEENNE